MASGKSGEFRGKSVEAAVSTGLAALGLTRDEADIEIIRPGSRGLLGIGAEDAVVRVSARGAGTETAARVEPRPEPAGVKSEPAAPPRQETRPPARAQTPPPAAAEPAAPPAAPAAPVSLPEADAKTQEAVERGRDFLTNLLERMNLRARVEVVPQSEAESDEDERAMVLNIVGDDLGMLIGRQSEVLSSLQFLVRLMVNQESKTRCNLIVDVNGYKAKRAESLRKLALRTAEQVMQTGRTMALEPMPPAERRIVHLALRSHANVTTQSVGEGTRRKVTIIPKKG